MSDIPLSLAHLSELDVPPLELVELAARAGFASIGLRTSPASPGGVVYPLRTAAEQAEMRRRLADNGVKVLEVEMVPLSAATRVADYRPMLETGAAIGASRLTVGGDSADFAVVAGQARRNGGARAALRHRGRSRIHAVPAGADASRDALEVRDARRPSERAHPDRCAARVPLGDARSHDIRRASIPRCSAPSSSATRRATPPPPTS